MVDDNKEAVANRRDWAHEIVRLLAHLDTLSAGAIVVIATFAENFAGRAPGGFLALAVVGFAITIFSSLISAFFLIASLPENDEQFGFIAWCALVAAAC